MPQTEAVAYALVVGLVLLQLRERRGWTQADLAGRVGLTQSTLSRIERGQAQPDAFTIHRVAAAFGMSTAEFNATVEDAYRRTREAAENALKSEKKTPWWQVALGVAGVVGLAGLAAFAVSAALSEGEPRDKKKPDGQGSRPSDKGGGGAGKRRDKAR